MHYSEPLPDAITPKQRRKHSPRVATLPPCANDMDLMIEAKDKEQAVFELMRRFKLSGYERIGDARPFIKVDVNRVVKGRAGAPDAVVGPDGGPPLEEDEVGMGGANCEVYWPEGYEFWLKPQPRTVPKRED